MAKFKVVTPAGVSYGAPGASYELEMEALGPLGAEIVEVAAQRQPELLITVDNGISSVWVQVPSLTSNAV